jgi:hypothetical protein
MANFVRVTRAQNWISPVLAVLLLVSPWVGAYSADLERELRRGVLVTEDEPGSGTAKDGFERGDVSFPPVECSSIFGNPHLATIYCDD